MTGATPVVVRTWATVVEMLAAAATEAPDAEALVFGDRRLTYATYLACVAGFARELYALQGSVGCFRVCLAKFHDFGNSERVRFDWVVIIRSHCSKFHC